MIPDEVVEAAARALAQPAPYDFDAYPQHWMKRARAALEAAAPHLMANAKAEALEDAIEWLKIPSQPGGGFAAGWLKIRAEEYRKGNL